MRNLFFCMAGVVALAACAGEATPEQRFGDLGATDDGVAREAVSRYAQRGEEAIPELRDALNSGDVRVTRRAREALAKITGQWGAEGDGIPWKRSVADAKNDERPLLVLQLFGEFDEEFC